MARPKSFVVCSITTKWCAPTTKKTPVRKLSRIQPATSTKERPAGPRGDPTKLTSRPGCLPTVVPKVDLRRPPPKPMLMPVPNKTAKVRKSPPLPLVPSLSKKTVVPKPSKVVARLKEGRLTGGYPEPVRSTQDMNTKELPPRPSCVPRARTDRSRVGVMMTSKEKQDVTVKISTTGPRNPVMARQKVSVNIGTTKAAGHVKVTETFVEKAMVAGTYRTGAPTTNGWPTTRKAFAYPHAVGPAVHIALSQPGSPDLSSFPSQSWITIDVDVKQNKGPTQICGNETLSSTDDVPNPGIAGTAKGSCGRSEPEPESVSSSPTLSPSPTFVETTESLSGPIIGLDGTVKISTPTKKPSNKVSAHGLRCDDHLALWDWYLKGQTHEGDGQKPPTLAHQDFGHYEQNPNDGPWCR
ncbi:hypothetical protein J3R82DRAFT_3750 [Butyriboletus roseoflavus]|nr:hypothetical protein J3R82DRAFT_3750 [Butyriboletus roseoflavus]